MVRRFSTNFAIFSMAVDALIIILTLWGMARIRPYLDGNLFKEIPAPLILPVAIYVLFPILWVSILAFLNVYDAQRNLRVVDEYTNLTLGSVLATITSAGALFLSYRDTSRAFFALFAISSYVAILLWRIPARLLYWKWSAARKGHGQRVLIAGAGPVGHEVRSRVVLYQHMNIEFAGFLDDDRAKRAKDPQILGSVDNVCEVVKEQHITDVVIALPTHAYRRINQVATDLQELPVKVWVVPDYFQFFLYQARAEDFLNIPMLDLRAPALTESERMIKRSFDLLVSLCLLIPFGIVMAVSALLIWLDDGSPVLFTQKRVGENGRLFTMYKFRTMVKGAEAMQSLVSKTDEDGNVIHKHPRDPRVTRVGRVLRRLSIDEFPQLFNVLRGTMSLVGPRPELPYLVEKYQLWQRKRFAVPQGMTGWWQIHGRSDKPMHLHSEEDLYYVRNYSIWLDIQILIRTVWIALRGKGAY
jgi:exopolysaccharide biosynthesis polyprenyl glycosylphosphotransferase